MQIQFLTDETSNTNLSRNNYYNNLVIGADMDISANMMKQDFMIRYRVIREL